MYLVFSEKVMEILEWIDPRLLNVLDYITSPGIVIPTFLLLVLIIYYLVSMTGLLRESNEDLKNQVIKYFILEHKTSISSASSNMLTFGFLNRI